MTTRQIAIRAYYVPSGDPLLSEKGVAGGVHVFGAKPLVRGIAPSTGGGAPQRVPTCRRAGPVRSRCQVRGTAGRDGLHGAVRGTHGHGRGHRRLERCRRAGTGHVDRAAERSGEGKHTCDGAGARCFAPAGSGTTCGPGCGGHAAGRGRRCPETRAGPAGLNAPAAPRSAAPPDLATLMLVCRRSHRCLASSSTTRRVSFTRDWTSSFRKICRRWKSTVCREM